MNRGRGRVVIAGEGRATGTEGMEEDDEDDEDEIIVNKKRRTNYEKLLLDDVGKLANASSNKIDKGQDLFIDMLDFLKFNQARTAASLQLENEFGRENYKAENNEEFELNESYAIPTSRSQDTNELTQKNRPTERYGKISLVYQSGKKINVASMYEKSRRKFTGGYMEDGISGYHIRFFNNSRFVAALIFETYANKVKFYQEFYIPLLNMQKRLIINGRRIKKKTQIKIKQ